MMGFKIHPCTKGRPNIAFKADGFAAAYLRRFVNGSFGAP